MQLIHQSPWELMSVLRRDVDRLYPADERNSFVPAVDIHEEDARYLVLADLPGVDAARIEITVEGTPTGLQSAVYTHIRRARNRKLSELLTLDTASEQPDPSKRQIPHNS